MRSSRPGRPPGDRLLLTLEDLAETTDEAADALVRAVEPHFDLHVVVTARDWSRQIPSEWQQAVKSRLTLHVPGVRDRGA